MPTPLESPLYSLTSPAGQWQGNVVDDHGVEWVVTGEDGWSSSPPVRPTIAEKSAADGSWSGPGFYAARVVELTGKAHAADRAAMLAAKDRLKAALGPRATVTLTVAEDHLTRHAEVRLTDQIQITDQTAQIFTWSIQVTAPDPRRYGDDTATQTATLPTTLTTGRTYPRTYPLVYGGGSPGGGGSVFVDQVGDYDITPAVIVFAGPLITPRIEHVQSGRNLTFDLELAYDETLVVDLGKQTAMLNGTANRAYTISAGSAWFQLAPGLNELAFRGAAGTPPPGVTPAPVPQMSVTATSAWT